MGRGRLGRFGTVWETPGKSWTGWDSSVGPGRVGGPSGRSGTGRGMIWEVRNGSGTLDSVWDGLWDPWEVRYWLGRSGTGRGTLREVWDGFLDSRVGPGWLGGPSRRSGTRLWTLG